MRNQQHRQIKPPADRIQQLQIPAPARRRPAPRRARRRSATLGSSASARGDADPLPLIRPKTRAESDGSQTGQGQPVRAVPPRRASACRCGVPCATGPAAMMSPTSQRGLSDPNGSWNTRNRQRYGRSALRFSFAKSTPWKSIVPPSGRSQPNDQPRQGRFPRAALADNTKRLAATHVDVHIIDRDNAAPCAEHQPRGAVCLGQCARPQHQRCIPRQSSFWRLQSRNRSDSACV